MLMSRLRQRLIINDGLGYAVNWAALKPGMSFFIPCLETEGLRGRVQTVARSQQMKVQMKIVIEEGVRGLRVWRVK